MRYFLGMEATRSKKDVIVSQQKYNLDLLIETGVLSYKPNETSTNAGKLSKDTGDLVETYKYQRLVGELNYLSHTWPNIAFTVSIVSQHMHSLKEVNLEAVNKILRYLKGTSGKGLFL